MVFRARVNAETPPNPGYINTVTATATGVYKDAETGEEKTTEPLKKTAQAETPVMWGFYKVNEKGQALVNLEDVPVFTLYSDADCKIQVTDSGYDKINGFIYFEKYLTGIGANQTFYMKETHTPSNYWENTAVYRVTTDSKGRVSIVSVDTANRSVVTLTEEIHGVDGIGIVNQLNPGEYELPNAGGMGTYVFTVGGALLMTAAILLFFQKQKKRSEVRGRYLQRKINDKADE